MFTTGMKEAMVDIVLYITGFTEQFTVICVHRHPCKQDQSSYLRSKADRNLKGIKVMTTDEKTHTPKDREHVRRGYRSMGGGVDADGCGGIYDT